MSTDDPRCPECGEKIGQTATYCMHCQADLSDGDDRGWADDLDGGWEDDDPPAHDAHRDLSAGETADRFDGTGRDREPGAGTGESEGDHLLDPDGVVDDTLTAIVGVVGGIVVGIVGTIALAFLTGSGIALPLGFVAWIGSTVYLVRQRTVQGAISRSAYAVAVVLLLVPFVTLSPAVSVDGGLNERVAGFVVLLLLVAIPALFAAGVGYVAGRFTPE